MTAQLWTDHILQRTETSNISGRMEKEGLIRGLAELTSHGLIIRNLVTDRHAGITKFMREQKPHIHHYFDAWHVCKSKFVCFDFILSACAHIHILHFRHRERTWEDCKDMSRSKRKTYFNYLSVSKKQAIKSWSDMNYLLSFIRFPKCDLIKNSSFLLNSIYTMAKSTAVGDDYGEIMDEKRKAMLNHLTGLHRHKSNKVYKRCCHQMPYHSRVMDKGTNGVYTL